MSEERTGEDRILTPANIITFIRIILVPVFVIALMAPWPQWFGDSQTALSAQPWVAAIIFILLAATDGVDGHLARSRNEVTTMGKFLDPLADKILVLCAMMGLVGLGTLPAWIPMVVAAREFIISGLRMLAAQKGVVIAARKLGKWKTAITMIAIVLFIVKDSTLIAGGGWLPAGLAQGFNIFAWIVMIAAVVLTIVSLIDYFSKSANLFTSRKQES